MTQQSTGGYQAETLRGSSGKIYNDLSSCKKSRENMKRELDLLYKLRVLKKSNNSTWSSPTFIFQKRMVQNGSFQTLDIEINV